MNLSLTLTGLDWVICGVTLVGSLLLGLVMGMLKREKGDSESFFLAGRTLTWPVVGLSLYATNIGVEHLVGLSGDSYRYGLKAGAVELSTALCLGIACWVLIPTYIRNKIFTIIRNKIFTIPEFLEKRYDVRARLFFSGLMLIICVMTKMAFTLFAGALVMHSLLGWDVMPVVLALALIAAVATMIGGFAAVAYTDAIQACIMICGCAIMLAIGLHKVGGWDQLLLRAGDKMHVAGPVDDPNFPFWGVVAGALYGGLFYWGMDQVNVQRILGARDLNHGRWGAMFATLLKLTPIFIFAMPGVIAYALYPGLRESEARQTFVVLLNNLLPSGLRGLVLAALLAALISSLLAVMNSVSTLVVRDFIMFFRPNMTEAVQVRLGRVSVLVASLLGVAGAWLVYHSQEGLYKYLQAISIYLVMPLTPAIFFGVVSKRVNMKGATAGVVFGTLVSALLVSDALFPDFGRLHFPWLHTVATENYAYRGLWATIGVTIVLFVVSWLTAPPPLEKVEGVAIDWHLPAEPFMGLRDWRLQLAVLSALTVLAYAWLW